MQTLLAEIKDITKALAGLRSDNIVIDNLDNILAQLKGSDILNQLDQYKRSMPTVPEDEQALETYKETMNARADELNKEADHFLDELERIKTIRHTLNLEALDPIITEARKIIHSLHAFTAHLEEGS
jgi:chaperonin cofactor prefoldin